MRQDKLLELRELQLRRDRLPALSFRHSSPPKNRALPDSVASAEISGPRRLTAEFNHRQKPATSCKIGRTGQLGPDDELAVELAWQTETQAQGLARDIRTLTQWLSHDVLALAGPALATRQMLFDFIVEELAKREPEDMRRIRPLRVALQNQRDDLLAFADVLDAKLADIAQAYVIPELLVREACVLHRLPSTSSAYWQGWDRLRAKLGDKFHRLFAAVSRAMAQNTAQQFAGREPQFTAAQLLHAAPSPGWFLLGLAAVLLEPSALHAQPTCRTERQKPAGIDDRPSHPHWLTLR
jgi:hypothetical protein